MKTARDGSMILRFETDQQAERVTEDQVFSEIGIN